MLCGAPGDDETRAYHGRATGCALVPLMQLEALRLPC